MLPNSVTFTTQSSTLRHGKILSRYDKIGHNGDPMSSSVIVRDPEILSGEPVFRGTRVPFRALTDYLEGGHTLAGFLDDFPAVTKEQAIAALEEARLSLSSALK
jgi:uncharacterized protein (DUF433 family)